MMSVITCRSNVLRGVRELAKRRPIEDQYTYVGGRTGAWEVTELTATHGRPLARVSHVDIVNGPLDRIPFGTMWLLSGMVRKTRHVIREERDPRTSRPLMIGAEATCAALIPIRKSAAWWALDQMQRREILETRSWSVLIGQQIISFLIRRLQHGRDLSEEFDDVTWFEFAPRDSADFDDQLAAWRASEEWRYVERACDIRLTRSSQ
jgi:hypothetical protein